MQDARGGGNQFCLNRSIPISPSDVRFDCFGKTLRTDKIDWDKGGVCLSAQALIDI
jgi:hypothetical protein